MSSEHHFCYIPTKDGQAVSNLKETSGKLKLTFNKITGSEFSKISKNPKDLRTVLD
jgi:hypothetical protein